MKLKYQPGVWDINDPRRKGVGLRKVKNKGLWITFEKLSSRFLQKSVLFFQRSEQTATFFAIADGRARITRGRTRIARGCVPVACAFEEKKMVSKIKTSVNGLSLLLLLPFSLSIKPSEKPSGRRLPHKHC